MFYAQWWITGFGQKNGLKMKLTLFFLLAGFLNLIASESYSQLAKLTISLRNATVEKVLADIEDNSEFKFVYNRDFIDLERKVDVIYKDAKVSDILDDLFKNTNVAYRFIDRTIVLSTVSEARFNEQTRKVSGRVTDASGVPLPGVTVIIKGTNNGVITDPDGKYALSQLPDNAVLVFSFIGMKSQEVPVSNRSTIDVKLAEETIGIEEVVAIGYGVQKKKLVTGATGQVKGDDIVKMNTTNPLQAMQGQTPGVNISSTSGQPGSDMKVTIRGLGTIGSSSPLYLIDGVGGDISTLNPADIESIDVLKDAASAAIYGAQAANGVVLITTKQGKEGKAKISFNAYYGVQSVAHQVDLLDAEQYKVIMDEQEVNSGNAPYDWSSFTSIYDKNGNLNHTDWIDAMLEDNATTESYALGVTGGSSASTYAVSLGYMNQEGVVGGKDVSYYERYNFRSNADQTLFKDILKTGEQVSFVYKKEQWDPGWKPVQ